VLVDSACARARQGTSLAEGYVRFSADARTLKAFQRVQHLWSLAYTNKEHFELVVDILLQRAKTSESFSEARRAIHNLEKWHVNHAKLANRFYSQAQTEVSRNIGIGNIDAAMKILGVIQQLPLSTKIPNNCFSDVFTVISS
jgi:hypothetical protein